MAKNKDEVSKKKDETTEAEKEKRFSRFLEEAKLTNDYLKHIATLDTGSIVIMATFLQNSIQPNTGSLLACAAVFLIASLAGVVATQIDLINRVSASADDMNKIPVKIEKLVYRIGTYVAYMGFILGLSVLGVFIFYTTINTSK